MTRLLALAWLGVLGCAHGSKLAEVEPERERTVVLADGVSVRATLWDRLLVVRTAEEPDRGTPSSAEVRRERTDRLQSRYTDGVVFTVLLELAHRPEHDDDPLADPKSWWFHLDRGGQTVTASEVDVLAIDRFPAGAVRAG